ncbi:uncharacterized protein M421DRAFT_422529 [Didymella exigua CBS 183.55]|uniref:Uncharacterized protein n=1 Tax=Didymella exigua CBS 183.55 TaxID=1150837 RepID=A0A6A5RHI7_9PLEO|nr:uncharacterized protein M421DRAFT_422529 [Didymella exigua CBS 183.55]KAF1926554.1 hypothetical protein M421DRAFT_422529 [Didymella exigua CBS 183.55]
MLSLPLIAPRADASLWPSHRDTNPFPSDEPSTSTPNAPAHQHAQQRRPTHQTSALLATLTQDENTLEQRKANVQRFGAGWIRPPGVAKTLQAITDEEMEKAEQEAMSRREQVMMDLAAAQQEAANAEERQEREEMEGDGEMGEERDLDDDVPEAEASASELSASDVSSDEEGSVSDTEDGAREQESIPFNEDSFIEGSMVEAEVSAMLEQEEAEMAGVLQDERDLDDDIPEAGSYEHTDSEMEDSSDDDAASRPPGMSSVRTTRSMRRSSGFQSVRRSTGRRSTGRRSSGLPVTAAPSVSQNSRSINFNQSIGRGIDLSASIGNGRSSFGIDGSSSILEGSSFLRSSPAAQRTNLRDQFLRAARGSRRGWQERTE